MSVNLEGLKLAVIMPACIQVPALRQMAWRALANIRTQARTKLYLSVVRPVDEVRDFTGIQAEAAQVFRGPIKLSIRDRCVSASWNWGCELAIEWGADYLLLLATDALVEPECIDCLLQFGAAPENQDVAIWSGLAAKQHRSADPAAIGEGCDFNCVMLRPKTIWDHGWFDEHYRPAYFEDNDYFARVVLGNGRTAQIHAARFHHVGGGSQTINLDADMRHHKDHWWPGNACYFRRKWGVQRPFNTPRDIRRYYNLTPFDDPKFSLDWTPAS